MRGVTLISVLPLQLGINSFQVGDREAFPPDLVDLLPFFFSKLALNHLSFSLKNAGTFPLFLLVIEKKIH